jgi:MipA family protein
MARDRGSAGPLTRQAAMHDGAKLGAGPSSIARFVIASALGALCATGPAFADGPFDNSIANPAIASASSDWVVTLGGWGNISPEYSGSKKYNFGGSPIIDFHRVGEKQWLTLPKDGIDYELYQTDNFRFGPVGQIRWDFGNTRDRGLKEIANTGVDLSLEIGAFVEYWPTNFWRTRLEARNAVYGAEGWVFDLTSDVVWHPTDQWTVAAGPRLSIADSDYMNAYYGLNAAQAQSVHLSKFEASAGVRSTGAGIYAEYKWNEQLSTMASFEYERLVGDAAASPLVSDDGSPDQFTFSLGAKYSFVWNR